jgi:hypothetical protein
MRLPMILLSSAALCAATAATAGGFEAPPDEPPAASLPAGQVAGPDFRVVDPVRSDGLVRHYVIDSRFGTFPAYGRESLAIRLREVAALTRIAARAHRIHRTRLGRPRGRARGPRRTTGLLRRTMGTRQCRP